MESGRPNIYQWLNLKMCRIEQTVQKYKMGNESKKGRRPWQNLLATDITWSKENRPF